MVAGVTPGLQNRRAASSMLPVCSTHTRFRQNLRSLSFELSEQVTDHGYCEHHDENYEIDGIFSQQVM